MSTLALPHKQIVNVGIFFSAIGGALQNLISQPRMLAAMANDNVVPFLRPFVIQDGQEPRRAIVLCMFLTCIPCFAGACVARNSTGIAHHVARQLGLPVTIPYHGQLDAVSHTQPGVFGRVVRYFHWSTALLGALWCFGLMMFFSWVKGLLAIAICIAVRVYVKYVGVAQDWGDSVRGMQLELACTLLKMLNTTTEEEHTKNWRPQVLVFSKMDSTGLPVSPQILHFASQLKEGHGLVEVVGLVHGNDDNTYDTCQAATLVLRQHLASAHLSGFGHVYACKDALQSMGTVAEASGMGPLRSNTVVVGWPNTWESGDATPYVDMLHDMINCKKALMVLKNMETFPFNDIKKKGHIDVWWVLHDGGLLLLMQTRLKDFLAHARIEAEIHVVELSDSTISSLLPKRSAEELNHKKEALDRMKVSTLSFSVRNPLQYSQLTDELNDVGSFVEEEDVPAVLSPRKSKPPLPKGYISVDPRMLHAQKFNRQVQVGTANSIASLFLWLVMHYVEALTENLSSVLLIRGSGREVRERVLKAKSARLEVKRQLQAIRAKEVEAEKADHAEFVAKRFQEKKVVREQHEASVEAKRVAVLGQLTEHSKTWISPESIDDQLAEAAFATQLKEATESKVGNLGALSWLERLKTMKPVDYDDVDDEKK
ncbi:hypothetical protein DYB34_011660 [Aphanomyces astaci]|uniref:SLC12A transporter C-terminal domain-containing protein n=1 Tax=Aphanomyces astaci TaxID=112090 RepID=A0A418CCY7_APHAT|nr:hypothetical protein DYB34_011660 [Aphanomyces astaci]